MRRFNDSLGRHKVSKEAKLMMTALILITMARLVGRDELRPQLLHDAEAQVVLTDRREARGGRVVEVRRVHELIELHDLLVLELGGGGVARQPQLL